MSRSESEPAAIRDALYRQAFGAVRWVETIQAIRARGVTHIFECGPGKVLAGMVKRIEPDAASLAESTIRLAAERRHCPSHERAVDKFAGQIALVTGAARHRPAIALALGGPA